MKAIVRFKFTVKVDHKNVLHSFIKCLFFEFMYRNIKAVIFTNILYVKVYAFKKQKDLTNNRTVASKWAKKL